MLKKMTMAYVKSIEWPPTSCHKTQRWNQQHGMQRFGGHSNHDAH